MKKYLTLALVFTFLLLILPFLIIALFDFPSYDDMCRSGGSVWDYTFIEGTLKWMSYQNGRYFNATLVRFPLFYHYLVYPVLPIFFILSLFGAMFFWLKRATSFALEAKSLGLLAIFFVAAFLALMPKISEAIYWFAGSSHYVLTPILFLLLLGVFLDGKEAWGIPKVLLAAILVFAIIGSNEIMMMVVNGLLFTVLGIQVLKKKNILASLGLLGWAGLCSWIVISAAGSNIRMDKTGGGGQETTIGASILDSLQGSLGYIGEQLIAHYLIIPMGLLWVFLWVFYQVVKEEKHAKSLGLPPVLLLVWSGALFFGAVFVLYYSYGDYTWPDNRTKDLIFFLFLFLSFWNVLNVALKTGTHPRARAFYATYSRFLAIGVVVTGLYWSLGLLFLGKNIPVVYNDLWTGKAWRYRTEIAWRNDYIRQQNPSEDIVVPRLSKNHLAQTLLYRDLTYKKDHPVNKCYTNYFHPFPKSIASCRFTPDQFRLLVADGPLQTPPNEAVLKVDFEERNLIFYDEKQGHPFDSCYFRMMFYPVDKNVLRKKQKAKGYVNKVISYQKEKNKAVVEEHFAMIKKLPAFELEKLHFQVKYQGEILWEKVVVHKK